MSVEDYEKRQQLIAADQARSELLPDESPPEPQHTELTIQIGPLPPLLCSVLSPTQ